MPSRKFSPQNRRLLELFDVLPPGAVVPIEVAAAYKGVSAKTIRRKYALVVVSQRRVGVRKSALVAEKAA